MQALSDDKCSATSGLKWQMEGLSGDILEDGEQLLLSRLQPRLPGHENADRDRVLNLRKVLAEEVAQLEGGISLAVLLLKPNDFRGNLLDSFDLFGRK